MSARANLIEDGGAGAADGAAFFRSPAFLAAEEVTHTLAIDDDGASLRLPLVVREIEGADGLDAISPYGYPGASGSAEPPPSPESIDWSQTGLVSVFVRDRVGDPPAFEGGSERSALQIADPRQKSGIRKRLREQIRANERRGWQVAAEPGAAADPDDRAAFEAAYAQTMARTGASERYLYSRDYFEGVLSASSAWLLLAGRDGGRAEAGAIAASSDGCLHYYLGGTADAALEDSPMKNLFAAMISLAGELGLTLNLGGGVAPGDSLEGFKQGFANATEPFRTHELICDPRAYEQLSRGKAGSEGFFPAYRAP